MKRPRIWRVVLVHLVVWPFYFPLALLAKLGQALDPVVYAIHSWAVEWTRR